MRKLILRMSVTLDGFMAGPAGEMRWLFPAQPDPVAKQWIADMMWQAGAHLMGSRTYADMAAYWPKSDDVIAAPMNAVPKVVFSRSQHVNAATTQALVDASSAEPVPVDVAKSWAEPRVASGDLAQEIARLKAEPGKDLVAHGGVAFARSLVSSGLIDEYVLVVAPVALGRGQGLFSELAEPLALDLVSSTRFPSGSCAQVLRPKRG
ncbi:MAG TPA: dihydrofolate reductase family protein [Polyangiaceae bacterium]|jgi:dihydrofolate reductase